MPEMPSTDWWTVRVPGLLYTRGDNNRMKALVGIRPCRRPILVVTMGSTMDMNSQLAGSSTEVPGEGRGSA